MGRIRVVLAEDNLLAREGVTRLLEASEQVELVGVAADVDMLRDAVARLRPDVVVTDIRMPPDHTDEGIHIAAELRSSRPEIGVVVLSAHAEPLYALALFEDGSERRAYLLKDRLRDGGELERAIIEVASGRALVDPAIVGRLLDGDRRSNLDGLTARERQVLALIAEGRSNAAIAEELAITKRAVERHVNSIFARLELREDRDVHRRVRATLMYLSGTGRT